MRIGIQLPSFSYGKGASGIGPTFGRLAREADDAGVDSLWVMDHFFQIRSVGAAEEPMLEGWSALAFAAALTRHITLGTMVTGVHYRHPGVLVKTATTLDVLSGGRAWLGIGAGWNEQESRGLGIGFPSLTERFERLEETLQIALQMWAGDESPYAGKHFQLERPLSSPAPVSRPHPPVLIGGGGEKKTLRLVARYADACNLFDTPDLPHKLAVLREHCEREGRDQGEIEKTALHALSGDATVDQAVESALDGRRPGGRRLGRRQPVLHQREEVVGVFHGRQVCRVRPVDAACVGDPLGYPPSRVVHRVEIELTEEGQGGHPDICKSVERGWVEFALLEVVPVGRHLEGSQLHLPDEVTDRRIDVARVSLRPVDPPGEVRLHSGIQVTAGQRGPLRLDERAQVWRDLADE